MSSANKFPPLIEVIFELHWGEAEPGRFSYSLEEQSLFAGQVSAAAAAKGFVFKEFLQHKNEPPLPKRVTHRFRRGENQWPCIQVGLGVFTVNQIDKDYAWASFLEAVASGLKIFSEADRNKLSLLKDSLTVILRYQDAFFPPDRKGIEDYLEENFEVNVKFPDAFFKKNIVNRPVNSISLNFEAEVTRPKGKVTVAINNAIINNKPGLIMETVVESKVTTDMKGSTGIDDFLSWAVEAHDLQRHAFRTLINKSAFIS